MNQNAKMVGATHAAWWFHGMANQDGTDWLEVPFFEAYVSEYPSKIYPSKIWPEIWYSSSILGSWNSQLMFPCISWAKLVIVCFAQTSPGRRFQTSEIRASGDTSGPLCLPPARSLSSQHQRTCLARALQVTGTLHSWQILMFSW